MGSVGSDQNMVTGAKIAFALALDVQACRTGEEQNPFVMCLTMRFVSRCRLTGRNDALDAQVISRKYCGENLGICARRNAIEKVHCELCHRSPIASRRSRRCKKGNLGASTSRAIR